ncbi:MAG: type I phosphomannose isomerase catalytic subunit [Candidatus Acidiferrum sp.]
MSASAKTPEPFRIEPSFSERLWGSRSLAPLFPEMHDLDPLIGEAWLTGVDCRIASGPFTGQTLGQAWKEMSIGWRGARFEGETDFPLLLKFIFPTDKLSIQVHPDDTYAAAHEACAGGRGKTEMWYIVSAEPGARLLAGLKPGVTKEKLLAALSDHTLEDLFQSHEAHAGDTFFIPAGMPHTIGPNMVICEVQEYSDLTYRIYDYDRRDADGKPRELHIEKALDVLNFDSGAGGKVAPRPLLIRNKKVGDSLVDCAYFSASTFEFGQRIHVKMVPNPSELFSLWVFLEGEGGIGWSSASHGVTGKSNAGRFSYKQGECWFIPAEFASRGYYPNAKTRLLVASPSNPKNELEKWNSDAE